jgi:hypothetical protein
MKRQIGGFTVEGRYFIVQVPDGWNEMEPLPDPSPSDLWFDNVSRFKAALRGPWIRRPVWRSPTPGARFQPCSPPTATALPSEAADLTSKHPNPVHAAPGTARSRSLGDLTDADGGHREIAYRLGGQRDS